MSFVRGGLRDLSISRTSFTWGIPVPDAPGHVMYVWLDALNNYVTACGFPDETAPRWPFWPADVHFVGKDIIRFHAVYWPAFLMAAGLPVPQARLLERLVDGRRREDEQVARQRHRAAPARGDLRARPGALLPAAREAVRRRRLDVSHQAIVTRINVELANDLGNLAQRSLSLIARNCGGRAAGRGGLSLTDDAELLRGRRRAARPACASGMDRQTFHEALEEVWKVIRAANGYIDRQAPWALRRTDQARMGDGAARAGRCAARDRHGAAAVHARQHGADARSAWGAGQRAAIGRSRRRRWPTATALPPPQGVYSRAMWSRPREAASRIRGA